MKKSTSKIDCVLVANRAEIARRICRTLKKLNIKSIAVYSDADAESPLLSEADDAIWIGPSESKVSYLNIDTIINAAISSGAKAIHPGYGFLSENPDFATACAKAGIVFIGPSPDAISTVADKRKAKQIAQSAKVPTTASVELSSLSTNDVTNFAKQHGLPLLIKAAFGGGGRGMRIVRSLDEVQSLTSSASEEASKFFSSSEVFIETYIEDARHIEVQILGSNDGQVIALGTRDCSWQRSYQKVIEEAPALGLLEGFEDKLIEASINIAKAVKYVGAGTVEFLVKGKDFYFLEVNSRLQVEHPITEMIYNVDLVEAQIRIAMGQSVSEIFKTPITRSGHAIEARICAENTRTSFTPQTGFCSKIDFPETINTDQIKNRFDFAFDKNGQISHFYDSMIGKVIVWADNKDLATQTLKQQITQLKISGIITNTEFVLRLINDPRFQSNRVFTNSLTTNPPAIIPEINDKLLLVAAVIWSKVPLQVQEDCAFRILGDFVSNLIGQINNVKVQASCKWIQTSSDLICAEIDNILFSFKRLDENKILIKDNLAHFEQVGFTIYSFTADGAFCVELPYPKVVTEQEDLSNVIELKSTLPGKVINLSVAVGQQVQPMDTLLTIESMKMEHHVKSPRSGIIDAILVEKSQVVAKNSVLVRFKNIQ